MKPTNLEPNDRDNQAPTINPSAKPANRPRLKTGARGGVIADTFKLGNKIWQDDWLAPV